MISNFRENILPIKFHKPGVTSHFSINEKDCQMLGELQNESESSYNLFLRPYDLSNGAYFTIRGKNEKDLARQIFDLSRSDKKSDKKSVK